MATDGAEHQAQAAANNISSSTSNTDSKPLNAAAAAAGEAAGDPTTADDQPRSLKRSNSSEGNSTQQGSCKKQKRVTFGENVVLGFAAAPAAGDDGFDHNLEIDECQIDAEAAAEARTRKRRAMQWMTEAMDAPFSDYLSDLQEAEEDYEHPDELFNSEGIPIEPFHLRKERAEGFFDEEGNYVERRILEESDAWLDSLQDGPGDLESDVAARLAAAAAAVNDEDHLPSLDEDDVAIYKKRIIDMLHPGENVLQALRRLATGMCQQPAAAAEAAAAAAAGERQRRKKQQRLEKEQQQQPQGSDASSVQQQQQQQPSGQQLPSIPAAAAAVSQSDTTLASQQNPNNSSSSSSSKDSGQRQPTSPRVSLARIPLENRHTFNKLTEYADLLLSNGDTNIYSDSREVLLGQLDMADLAIMLGEDVSGAAATTAAGSSNGILASEAPAAAAEEDVDMFAADEEQPQNASAGTAAAAAAVTNAGHQQDAAAAANDTAAEAQDTAVDAADDAADACTAAAAGSSSIMDGFVLDESSGYYYSSSLGYYFEPSSGLFGDASSGLWYRYQEDTGTYQLVESV